MRSPSCHWRVSIHSASRLGASRDRSWRAAGPRRFHCTIVGSASREFFARFLTKIGIAQLGPGLLSNRLVAI
jgi:hypothetical protein